MQIKKLFWILGAPALLGTAAAAQHSQTSAVAVNPTDPFEVWAADRDNGAVSVVDLSAGVTTHQVDVGVFPRSVAITPDGQTVLVANQRGNVSIDVHFVTPFSGTEVRGSLTVIDAVTKTVTSTLTDVGVEPFGVAVAPNGKYFAVSATRSGRISFYSLPSLSKVAEFQYLNNLNFIPAPFTLADVDTNRDGVADLGDPRGFVIRSDSQKIYVTHKRSTYVSALDVTLDANGLPTAVALAAKIDTNKYPFDPIFNATFVRDVKSQGLPRFLEDIALSPDGSRALVPHVLHNINHDVNFDFNQVFPGFPGNAVNRTYPALTLLDAAADSFDPGNDNSNRLNNELSDPLRPAAYVPFGKPGPLQGGLVMLGGQGSPVLGGTLTLQAEGIPPGHSALVVIGSKINQPAGGVGFFFAGSRFVFPMPASGILNLPIPNVPELEGKRQTAQLRVFNQGGMLVKVSNALDIHLSAAGRDVNEMGQRAGHPSRVAFNAAGDRALLLNRASEDLFLYDVNGSDLRLRDVFPPRHGFVARAPLDTNTPMGDMPLGMAVVADPTTTNDDALIYVVNEVTRTLSVVRVGWKTGTIFQEQAQIPLLKKPDVDSLSKLMGQELFEDASRGQTTAPPGTVGELNNSCGSCHFEGGEDANVWQRGNGPRSTMPVYDGTLLTGLILWKGVRLNLGETGPMFHGENGGTGVFTDAEQQALIDYHEKIPVPLNANLDPATGGLTPLAAIGQDLFFGTNNTGTNGPNPRSAGCAACHPAQDSTTLQPMGFTADVIDPILSSGENLEWFDRTCFNLQSNAVALNIRNVNSGVDVDFDLDGQPDLDRNVDGYIDVETYTAMNTDKNDDFTRDDTNSYMCPEDPAVPNGPLKVFGRDMREFSIPTKLGVITSGPYFHDHSAISLRSLVDPEAQALSAIYGSAAFPGQTPFPGLNKFFNEFHDVRGHEQFVPGASKVQINLQSTNPDADIEAILAFIQSL